MYAESLSDPEGFWSRMAERVDWIRPFTKVRDVSFDAADLHIRWYEDGLLNVSANCLDRHLATRGNKTAIIWEGDDPRLSEHITYRQLYERVCRYQSMRNPSVNQMDLAHPLLEGFYAGIHLGNHSPATTPEPFNSKTSLMLTVGIRVEASLKSRKIPFTSDR